MEHKLVLGGEKYLPFARSRIKALRAAGLRYASQKFTIDGTMIEVRVVNEHDYILIDGESLSLNMDSGVVRLDDWDLFGAGHLFEPASTADYNIPFTKEAGEFFTNPSDDESTQFSGQLTFSGSFKGRVPRDGAQARSFAPQEIPDTGNPGRYMPDPEDEALLAKSTMARHVPASVFCGRTRLYVQAMYGAWLHPDRKTTQELPTPVYGNYAAPYLTLPNFTGGGDTTDYPQRLHLTTNNGVYFDSITGKHWLVEPPNQNAQVSFYPLVSSAVGERLRRYLRSDSKKVLTEQAREHLEAYILSAALPDRANVVHVPVMSFPRQPTSMGYGWHFNWSGTAAVFVLVEDFSQGDTGGGEATAKRSTVFTLAISASRDEQEAITFSAVLDAGASSDWTVSPSVVCITEPGFVALNQNKITRQVTVLFPCAAPFYAFYKKDELQLCTIVAEDVEAQADLFTGSRFATGTNYSTCPTIGMDRGYGENLTRPGYQAYRINVGTASYGPAPSTHSQVRTAYEINKIGATQPAFIDFNVAGTANIPFGYPITISPNTWNTVFVEANLSYPNVPWDIVTEETETETAITNRGTLVAFAPVFDAEAICVDARWTVTEQREGETRVGEPYPGWLFDNWTYPYLEGWTEPFTKYTKSDWGPSSRPGYVAASTVAIDDTSSSSTISAGLHAGRTSTPATVSIAPFFADAFSDEIMTASRCRSGASDTPIIASDLASLGMDTTDAEAGTPAIVGFA